MRTITITSLDHSNLKEAYRNHKKPHVRNRAHAILLNVEGFKIKDIAKIFRVRTRTIYQWLNRWEELGYQGLLITKDRGRKADIDLKDPQVVKVIKKR